MDSLVALKTQREKSAEYRKNPEYVAMFERVAKRFAEIDRVRAYTLRN